MKTAGKKESQTKRLFFRLGITKPTWQGKHLPTEMKQKISRTKIRQYKEGKIKPPWKDKKPPFYSNASEIAEVHCYHLSLS